MEGFLIFIVLILVVIIIARNNAHHKEINNSVDSIHQKLNQLRKELASLQSLEAKPKEDLKPTPKVEPDIIKPVEEQPTIIPPKPLVADAVIKPIPIPEPLKFTEQAKPKEPLIPKKSWFKTFKEKKTFGGVSRNRFYLSQKNKEKNSAKQSKRIG